MRTIDPISFVRVSGVPGVGLITGEITKLSFRTHLHPELVLGVVQRGAASIKVGHDIIEAVPGTVLTVAPNQAHSGRSRSHDDGHSYMGLHVTQECKMVLDDAAASAFVAISTTSAFWQDQSVFTAVVAYLKSFQACEDPDANRKAFASLISALASSAPAQRLGLKSISAEDTSPEAAWLTAVKKRIDEDFDKKLTLQRLALEAQVSKFHLLRHFRRRYGITPHDYLLQRRTAHAQCLLAAGHSPAVVAYECGFSDQAHLIRIFKSHFGLTPGRYALARRPS